MRRSGNWYSLNGEDWREALAAAERTAAYRHSDEVVHAHFRFGECNDGCVRVVRRRDL